MSDSVAPPLFVITSTWDSAGLIEPFLEHQFKLGVDLVYVIDLGSTDGTLDVLGQSRWGGSVRVYNLPHLRVDSAELVLQLAREKFGYGWCQLCDPDEYMLAPGGNLRSVFQRLDETGVPAIRIPRFNMTASRATALAGYLEQNTNFRSHLIYEIREQCKRSLADGIPTHLEPPWIYTKIPPKVTFRIEQAVSLSVGGHRVELAQPGSECLDHGLHYQHYPIRSFAEFEHKIRCAKMDFAINFDAPPSLAWHWRRWVKFLDQGRLHEEYLAQFLDDVRLPDLLARGVVVRRSLDSMTEIA